MASLIQKTCSRNFHVSAVCSRTPYKHPGPVKVQSIAHTAAKLGFKTPQEMYPEYPVEEPPTLWMIEQIKKLQFRPYWEKEAMKELGLYKKFDISIQINYPKMNEILWSVKHLIRVLPVRFPQGLPTKEDIGFTQLQNDGRFIIEKTLIESQPDANIVPTPLPEDWKVVDGYRMCNGCKHKRCLKYGMCQRLWRQKGFNHIEEIGPKLFNFIDNPLKTEKEAGKSS